MKLASIQPETCKLSHNTGIHLYICILRSIYQFIYFTISKYCHNNYRSLIDVYWHIDSHWYCLLQYWILFDIVCSILLFCNWPFYGNPGTIDRSSRFQFQMSQYCFPSTRSQSLYNFYFIEISLLSRNVYNDKYHWNKYSCKQKEWQVRDIWWRSVRLA